jgi:plasmid maintenance system antidote protein VapI
MKLKDYIALRGLKPTEAAAAIGISQSAISRFLNGERGFSLETAGKIEKWSKGAVTPKELLAELNASRG